MLQKLRKHPILLRCLSIFLAMQAASCGTVLHPERRGQPAGRLDAAVVALDAVGLVLFLVPGVIAFAVDFSNGTIYLPPEGSPVSSLPSSQDLKTVQVNSGELTPQRLEAILREQTGQTVRLEPGTYRAAKIGQIQDFPPTLSHLQAASVGSNVVFRGSAE